MSPSRIVMSRATGGDFGNIDLAPLAVRSLTPLDGQLLGVLMYDAYYGTIDYRDESLDDFKQELEETIIGRYGDIVWNASFVAIDSSGVAVSVSVVTLHERLGPLLAFTSTLPSQQNKGLAGALIKKSLVALEMEQIQRLTLVVTPGNDSAIALYVKLGFTSNSDI